ncbi:MAG TPA: peptidoglycan DD-metalloendopeptidase family protein [Nocardioides sp.]|nr:peptidoglycan DD-metalloendopeptidase family protein [Nocardioides sp.]
MRLFPGARRQTVVGARSHRNVAVATALVLAAAVAGPMAYAEGHHHGTGHLHHQQHQVHGQIKRVAGDLDDVSSKVLRITTRLHVAEGRLKVARTTLVRTQRRLTSARAVEKRLQSQLRTAQTRLERATAAVTVARQQVVVQRAVTAGSVIDYATEHNPSLAAVDSYLSAGSLQDLNTGATAQDVVVGEEQIQLGALQTKQADLQQRQSQVQTRRNQVRAHRVSAQRTVVRIHGLVLSAAATKKRVKTLVVTTRSARAAAVRAKRADLAKLHRLRREEAAIKQKILAATAGDSNHHVGSTHGMFVSPVANSYITSPYGWRMHPIYHYWGLHDGDDLHAPCGTPEVAVGSGKVIEQYYSDIWGNRLYLDLGRINGHGYVAIYNHISAYRSHVGERVSRGETIALAGTTGWSTGCHLHFTLMRDGATVDPAPYIGF